MGTVSIYVILGRTHLYHGGLIPIKILTFWENDVPHWSEFGVRESIIHVPESPEFKFIITDMLLCYAYEYSRARDALQKMRQEIEKLWGGSFERFMARLDMVVSSKEHKGCMEILNKMRRLLERRKLDIEALIVCFKEAPVTKVEDNLKRLKMKYNLVVV